MPRQPSPLEQQFVDYWRLLAPRSPQPIAEYPFAKPRKFRFDFAWPNERVAVDLEGGIWNGGRHTSGKGYEADCEKYNLAVILGWRVLRYTGGMINTDPEGCIRQVTGLFSKE